MRFSVSFIESRYACGNVPVSPESDGIWKRTGASLVVGVVGHHVSPVEVSGEHKRDVHDPVDYRLRFWSQLHG